MKTQTKPNLSTTLSNDYLTSNRSQGSSSKSQQEIPYLPNINEKQSRNKVLNDVKNARITVTHKNNKMFNLTINPTTSKKREEDDDIYSLGQSRSTMSVPGKIDAQKNLRQYHSVTRIHTQLENKPYLKLYQQKNQTHDADREKSSSIAANIVVNKVQSSNLLFGMADQDAKKKDKHLDLNLDTLVMLGQEVRTKIGSSVDVITPSLNNTSNYEIKVTSPPQTQDDTQNVNSTQYINNSQDKVKEDLPRKRLTLKELMQQKKENRQRTESIDKYGNVGDGDVKTLQLPIHHQREESFDSFRTDISPSLNRETSTNVGEDQTPKSNNDQEEKKEQEQRPEKDYEQRKLRNKNLQCLIKLMKTDRLKKEILVKDPTLTNLSDETKAIFREDLLKKKITVDMIKGLPLAQKLENIEKFNLDPKLILTKTEQKTLQLQREMHIPEQIKITNLKKLLHKSIKRVNKWVKNSLLAKYQHDFDFYMQNDKTEVDKNSLLYEKLLEEQRRRELLSSKLEASKGGYIDPNMRTIDLTHRKVINDLMDKFQLKNYQLMPIHDEKRDELERKLQDVAKLQMELIKEHEKMEQRLRAEKEKKFAKWQIINQEYKKKQATMGAVLNTYDISPEESPVTSPKRKFDKNLLAGLMPSTDGKPLSNENPDRKLLINPQRRNSNTKTNAAGTKFREYLMEKLEKNRNEQLIKQLDEELTNQDKLIKTLNKDIDEFQYFNSKKRNGEMNYEQDPLIPDEFYVKSGKSKHFSKNIALWKQQEIYDEIHGDWNFTMKKFRILQQTK